jgi:hypothetical protein
MRSTLAAHKRLPALVLTVIGGVVEVDQARAADTDVVVLLATGSQEARVRGRCVLRRAGGDQVFEIDEAVPFERRWKGAGLHCELEAQGRVTVKAIRDGSRSRSSVSGGRMVIEIR